MSPILAVVLSMLLAQAPDAPAPAVEAPAAPAAPTADDYPIPPGAPVDDYGLVAWCYGALAGHVSLYDKVIGDVEDIEVRIAKLPGAPPADMASYKNQREVGRDTLKQFRRAMEAAEKASPKPIATYGAENLRKGGQVWSVVRETKDKKYLAREWMSWGLPGRCLPTAERLEARSSLFGQALTYNVKPAEASAPPPEDVLTVPTEPMAPDAEPVQGTPLDETNGDPDKAIENILPGETAPPEEVAAASESVVPESADDASAEDAEAANDETGEEPGEAEAQDAPPQDVPMQLRGPQD